MDIIALTRVNAPVPHVRVALCALTCSCELSALNSLVSAFPLVLPHQFFSLLIAEQIKFGAVRLCAQSIAKYRKAVHSIAKHTKHSE